jgi:hypothetical protein
VRDGTHHFSQSVQDEEDVGGESRDGFLASTALGFIAALLGFISVQ